MPGIVLSYRRADSRWIVGRIFDRLEAHFGRERVFMDIDGVPLGIDFREHLRTTLEGCDVLLAIIGPHWAKGLDGVNRLDSETDWVRLEIETALQRNVPVIPVLIDDAQMPDASLLPETLRPLTFRQGARIDTGVDFRAHMDRLIRALEQNVQATDSPGAAGKPHAAVPPAAPPSAPAAKAARGLFGSGWLRTVIGVLIIVALVRFLVNDDELPQPPRGDPRTSDAVSDLVQSKIRESLADAKNLQGAAQQAAAGAGGGAGAGAATPSTDRHQWRVAAKAATGCWERVTGDGGGAFDLYQRIGTYEDGVELGAGPDIAAASSRLSRVPASTGGIVAVNDKSFRHRTWTFTTAEPNTLVIDQPDDRKGAGHSYPLVYQRIECSE